MQLCTLSKDWITAWQGPCSKVETTPEMAALQGWLLCGGRDVCDPIIQL